MRKIVASMFMTLDGVVESPNEWHFPYFDDAMATVMAEIVHRQTAYLIGRNLYDEWSQYWPAHENDDPFGQFINPVPKFLLTHRPVDGELWANTTVLRPDDPAEITRIKNEGDGDIGMSGSSITVRWLADQGLLDELNLLVDPVCAGHGRRLFEGDGQVPLSLVHSAALPTGVLHLRYQLAG